MSAVTTEGSTISLRAVLVIATVPREFLCLARHLPTPQQLFYSSMITQIVTATQTRMAKVVMGKAQKSSQAALPRLLFPSKAVIQGAAVL